MGDYIDDGTKGHRRWVVLQGGRHAVPFPHAVGEVQLPGPLAALRVVPPVASLTASPVWFYTQSGHGRGLAEMAVKHVEGGTIMHGAVVCDLLC